MAATSMIGVNDPTGREASNPSQPATLDLSSVTVIIPALNEEASLPLVLNDLPRKARTPGGLSTDANSRRGKANP